MNNKKVYMIGGIVILVVALAAFFAARMINSGVQGLNPSQWMGDGGGEQVGIAIDVVPAPELPVTQPEVVGLFVVRQDNTITVQSIPMGGMNEGGGVVITSSGGEGGGASVDTPQFEVVITNETLIYKETTEISEPTSGEQTVQQTVGAGSLDDLSSQTFITVWGRKNGDRIIAEVLFYSNPVMIQAP